MTEIKNLKKTAKRILRAIKEKENIILYGDSDMDGVSSLIIVKETIENLGGMVTEVYFPQRENEGYGITETALNFLKKYCPALLITLDCGISNFNEIDLAKKFGFEVIVIDHHEILKKLPKASIIIDPKQKGDQYPFKLFSTAGLVFKLSQQLLGDQLSDALRKNFLELAALATIADMMPEDEENKIIIEEGLVSLAKTFRPGLQVLLAMPEIKNKVSIRQIAQEIISILNIVDPKGHLNATYLILSTSSLQEAREIALDLLAKRDEKYSKIKEITEIVKERLAKKLSEPLIFESDNNWPFAFLGSVASRICNEYQKPTFIISKKAAKSRGAVRMPKGFNSVKLMEKCSKCLISFGGHPLASGFEIANENLDELRSCLIKNLRK
jgi:single-stranded-DNA-specific exonuclease